MKAVLSLFLLLPIFAYCQGETAYDSIFNVLKNSRDIDSIYTENEFAIVIRTGSVNHQFYSSHTKWDSLNTDFKVKWKQQESSPLGYRISGYHKNQLQCNWYFDTNKQLESKVYFRKGKAQKVEIFKSNTEIEYYLELIEGKWLSYYPQKPEEGIDEKWKSFEMIKAMLLNR
ncbi:hypothetical protein [Croceimicrobium hydrocarbonivorans]|uniref:Uncharacterized protein n=1 Tax=Croceimicrobium hydrocarbonivorans TaxID=2761580 RepID=A0A7H0VC60_9FLAO|nr:hypothetical protein [Croceimicrobium hydrocarbonivorans]QNR23308.1 hypothetical protein H4K34_13100 [Croceimicrobium hydrocarbonivorans]